MRLDRTLRQPEPGGDLPISHTTCDKRQDFPLPVGKGRPRDHPAGGPRSADEARDRGSYGGCESHRGIALANESLCARVERVARGSAARVAPDHDNRRFWRVAAQPSHRSHSSRLTEVKSNHDCVRRVTGKLVCATQRQYTRFRRDTFVAQNRGKRREILAPVVHKREAESAGVRPSMN